MKLLPYPPRYPFAGQVFLLELFVADEQNLKKEGWQPVPFQLELFYRSGARVLDQVGTRARVRGVG